MEMQDDRTAEQRATHTWIVAGTEGRHTPGPWIAYNSDNGRILKHWRIRGGAVRNDPTFAVVDSGGRIAPEYEAANARLIAAAPDLLAFVRECARADSDCGHAIRNAARDAIRKAEGGE